jgi:hypothetical protein
MMPIPLAGGNGLSLNSPSDGADDRLSVERPLRLLSGFDKLTTALTLAGVGGGGPRGRLELVVLARLVAEPCNFLNCGNSPLGNTSLAPARKIKIKIIPTTIWLREGKTYGDGRPNGGKCGSLSSRDNRRRAISSTENEIRWAVSSAALGKRRHSRRRCDCACFATKLW